MNRWMLALKRKKNEKELCEINEIIFNVSMDEASTENESSV